MKIRVRMINCMLVTMSCWYGYLLTSGMCSLANRQAGPVRGRPPCCCDMRLVRMRIRRYTAGQPPLGHSSQQALARARGCASSPGFGCICRSNARSRGIMRHQGRPQRGGRAAQGEATTHEATSRRGEAPQGTKGGHNEQGGRHKESWTPQAKPRRGGERHPKA